MKERSRKLAGSLLRLLLCAGALAWVAASVSWNDRVTLATGEVVVGAAAVRGDHVFIRDTLGGGHRYAVEAVAEDASGNLSVSYGLRTTWQTARKGLLWAAVLVFAAVPLLQGFRIWRLASSEGISIRMSEAVRISLAGNFLNFAAPLGSTAGDVFKAYFLARHTHRKTEAMTLVFVDRALGLGTLLMAVAVTALLSAGDGRLAPLRGYVAFLLLLMLVGAALYLSPQVRRIDGLRRIINRFPMKDLRERVDAVVLRLWARKGTLASVLAATLLLQVLCAVSFAILCAALDMRSGPSLAGEYFAYFSAGELVKALPGPPQGFGTAELAYSYLFHAFGSTAQIVCAALGMRLIMLACALPGALLVAVDGCRPSAEREAGFDAWSEPALNSEAAL